MQHIFTVVPVVYTIYCLLDTQNFSIKKITEAPSAGPVYWYCSHCCSTSLFQLFSAFSSSSLTTCVNSCNLSSALTNSGLFLSRYLWTSLYRHTTNAFFSITFPATHLKVPLSKWRSNSGTSESADFPSTRRSSESFHLRTLLSPAAFLASFLLLVFFDARDVDACWLAFEVHYQRKWRVGVSH